MAHLRKLKETSRRKAKKNVRKQLHESWHRHQDTQAENKKKKKRRDDEERSSMGKLYFRHDKVRVQLAKKNKENLRAE